MHVLFLGPNQYQSWLTYEFEYLREAFGKNAQAFGAFRPGADESFERFLEITFPNGKPDAVITDISFLLSPQRVDREAFEYVQQLPKETFRIFKTADPWKQVSHLPEIVERYHPDLILCHSVFFHETFQKALQGSSARSVIFPYCIGDRYLNLGLERHYDLALIGRTQNGSKTVKRADFAKKFKVLTEPPLGMLRKKIGAKNYLKRFPELVMNLNQCLASWNSPVIPKGYPDEFHTPYRYIESAACGTISLTPHTYREMEEYYFPNEYLLDCHKDPRRGEEYLIKMRNDLGYTMDLRQRAQEFALANHHASTRVRALSEMIRTREPVDAKAFYGKPF